MCRSLCERAAPRAGSCGLEQWGQWEVTCRRGSSAKGPGALLAPSGRRGEGWDVYEVLGLGPLLCSARGCPASEPRSKVSENDFVSDFLLAALEKSRLKKENKRTA